MGLKDNGYLFWEPGQTLAMLVVVNKNGDHPTNGEEVVSIYEPSDKDIETALAVHKLDVKKAMRIVKDMGKQHHTLWIDVDKFREHLESLP